MTNQNQFHHQLYLNAGNRLPIAAYLKYTAAVVLAVLWLVDFGWKKVCFLKILNALILDNYPVFDNHSCLKTFSVLMTIKPSLLPPYNVLWAPAVVTPSYPVKSVWSMLQELPSHGYFNILHWDWPTPSPMWSGSTWSTPAPPPHPYTDRWSQNETEAETKEKRQDSGDSKVSIRLAQNILIDNIQDL